MISQEKLAQEYISIINDYYPETEKLLKKCYVRVIDFYLTRTKKNYYYIGVYYPESIAEQLLAKKPIFQEIAENMGLIEVVFLNANRLISDPLSKIKQEHPRFWLELVWIDSQRNR
jgi:L-rhamnose mutarotase